MKNIRKNDLILIGVLLAGFVVIFGALLLVNGRGSYVVVSVDSVEVASFPLNEDVSYEIQGYEGGRNTLVIKDGKAWVEDSSCPDHLCEHMGKIDKVGQSVICLPNRVVVEIREDGKIAEFDSISS